MIETLFIISNIIFFFSILKIEFSKILYYQLLIFVWSILNIGGLYLSINAIDASNPFILFYSIKLPLYGCILFVIAIFVLGSINKHKILRLLSVYFIVGGFMLLRYLPGMGSLVEQDVEPLLSIPYMFSLVIPFIICLLVPMGFTNILQLGYFKKKFLPKIKTANGNIKYIVICALLYFTIHIFFNYLKEDFLIYFNYNQSILKQFMHVSLITFYLIVLDHFVFIGLAKYIMDEIFEGDDTTYYEIILYAFIYVGFHFADYNAYAIIETFLFALIYGYLYLKTKTLFYGIILASLTLIFFG